VRWTASTRIAIVCVLAGIAFTCFSGRLVDLQYGRHEEFSQLAARKNSIRQIIPCRRGDILDRNGEVLATDIPTRTVFADGSHITDPQALAELAAPYLDCDPAELAERLKTERKYLVLARGVAEEKAIGLYHAMDRSNLRGIYFEQTSKRIYPNGSMLSHVIGFLDHEAKGVQGVEMTMEPYLRGENGFRHIERDRTGRELVVYRGVEQPPKHGKHIYLTIDMALQAIVEEEIENAYRDLNPQSITAVLVDPFTGEVLAMATRPHFDPNAVGEAEPEQMKNRAIIDMVEPGSTFKIVAMAAALNESVAEPETMIFCENGRYFYGGRTLRDHSGYGNLSVHDIMVKSSNIGSAKLAMMLGDVRYYEYVRSFGFGERTGIELPGEIPGLVHPPHRWSKISITRIPMGHEVAVTPLQITMAMGAIANGGKLMAPQIVHSIRETDGTEIAAFQSQTVRDIVRPEVAALVRHALDEVVSPRGTAGLAKVEGYDVAGKTGTAQRVDPNGGYTPGKYVVSFAGFMPVEQAEFTGLVIVDDAQAVGRANYGGLVAAPIFSRIAERAARYLDLEPALPALPVASTAAAAGGPRP